MMGFLKALFLMVGLGLLNQADCDSCPAGFSVGSDGKCEDVNECERREWYRGLKIVRSFYGVGYKKCLTGSMQGLCINTEGSYRCHCLSGSYTNSGGKECVPCSCNIHGVKDERVCDKQTGACLCRFDVAGADCGRCKTGFTNFPDCYDCDAGYYGHPNCAKCSCSAAGVTAQVCDPRSGRCQCKPNVGGDRCEKCLPHYKNYPACTKDVRDGTLGAWSDWSAWVDQGTCGRVTGYDQKRTRTRTCDDSTKNIQGKSCKRDDLLVGKEERFKACKKATKVFIRLPDLHYAGTNGNLYMEIRQGDNRCSTSRTTWVKPDYYKSKGGYLCGNAGYCSRTFDETKPVHLYLHSNVRDEVYVTEMGVKIGDEYKAWKSSWSGDYAEIDRDQNNGPYPTTTTAVNPSC